MGGRGGGRGGGVVYLTPLSVPWTIQAAIDFLCAQTLGEVLRVSGGDLRKAITFLQSASDLYNRKVTPANIIEIAGIIPAKLLADTVKVVKEGNFDTVC